MGLVWSIAPAIVLAFTGASAAAGDRPPSALWSALGAEYDRTREALAGGSAAPDSAQRLYDAGRDLALALPDSTSPRCDGTLRALRALARDAVAAAEWHDRRSPRLRDRALARAARSVRAVEGRPPSCADAPARTVPRPALLLSPRDGEAFNGVVSARVPAGAESARVSVDGAPRRDLPVSGRKAVTFVIGAEVSHIERLQVAFLGAGGRILGSDSVARVTRLPDGALDPAGPVRADPALDREMRSAARAFTGTSAIWVASLRAGRRGSWNADSRFPAASTVKLGVLAAAARRHASGESRDAVLHELESIAGWSSNLAANRLLRLLGDGDLARGRAVVERELRRLGAVRSTYPGAYRAGTARRGGRGGEGGEQVEPPLVSTRVTTARDLGQLLETVHRAAAEEAAAVRAGGLRPRDARLLIGLLLRATGTGENAGLISPFLPAETLLAQKNGWLSTAQHTAAIVYGPRGPAVCVVLAYRPGLTLREAQELGARVARRCGR